MKNYWLISGGIVIGLGLSSVKDNKELSILKVALGTTMALIGIYGFKK